MLHQWLILLHSLPPRPSFPDAGAVGIWSKAVSTTEFDNFQYEGKR